MAGKRRIALITSEPDNIAQERIISGVIAQCEKYNYDVAIFAPLVNTTYDMSKYLKGELNIYELINYEMFDGVIITPSHIFGQSGTELEARFLETMKKNCHCKLVSLEVPFADAEVVSTDDVGAFYEMARHMYELHGRNRIYFLNGRADYDVSQNRLKGFRSYFEEQGIEVPENYIFYGDFWYVSGEKLADDIVNGLVECPDAVVCANDYMAIGLANRLMDNGIKVPEQVAVMGYDGTQEALMNDFVIASYAPRENVTAAKAVNSIRRAIDPELEIYPAEDIVSSNTGFLAGESCGCVSNGADIRNRLRDSLLQKKANWTNVMDGAAPDIASFLGSFMSEDVMGAPDPINCIDQIYHFVFFLHPYGDFWICLKENWLDLEDKLKKGYPEKMKVVLHSSADTDIGPAMSCGFCDPIGERSFETKRMLPEMYDDYPESNVFYFSPIHGGDETLGYAVMRCPLSQKHQIGYLYQNWLRTVCNGLMMTRIRNRLSHMSIKDGMTQLLNRIGLEDWLERTMPSEKKLFVIMADMDGLKVINDKYGHTEGDYSLKVIARALGEQANDKIAAVRTGGDEFLLVGVGDFEEDDVKRQMETVERRIAQLSEESGKEYRISASLGYVIADVTADINMDNVLRRADDAMYLTKKIHHSGRQ